MGVALLAFRFWLPRLHIHPRPKVPITPPPAAMDCIPRTISRAQTFDALSSMANIAGYRCGWREVRCPCSLAS